MKKGKNEKDTINIHHGGNGGEVVSRFMANVMSHERLGFAIDYQTNEEWDLVELVGIHLIASVINCLEYNG